MDPDRFFTLCVLIACVLGKTRLSGAGNCSCPKIPEMDFTLREDGCFGEDSRYRYTCIEGYVRKAGTSNLIKCQEEKGHFNWTVSKLVCIRDPKLPTMGSGDPKLPTMGSGSTTQATALLETSTSHQSTRNSTSKANMHQSTSGTGSTTTVQPCTNSSSTHSPMERNNKTISTITAAQNSICITVSMVVLLAAVSGVVFLICRRRNRPTYKHQIEIEEMQPMNTV